MMTLVPFFSPISNHGKFFLPQTHLRRLSEFQRLAKIQLVKQRPVSTVRRDKTKLQFFSKQKDRSVTQSQRTNYNLTALGGENQTKPNVLACQRPNFGLASGKQLWEAQQAHCRGCQALALANGTRTSTSTKNRHLNTSTSSAAFFFQLQCQLL